MVRVGKRLDSSVIFIGEDEVPLLKDGWREDSNKGGLKNGSKASSRNHKNSTSSLRKSSLSAAGRLQSFPGTFKRYLFSESSVITRLVTSLCPPVGKYKRIPVDAEGSFLSCFLLACTLYWGFVNSRGEARINALFMSSSLTVGYLLAISGVTWLLSFCTKTIITLSQVIAVMSYGLFGHAITLIICTMGSDRWFMPLLTIVGGLGSLRICLILLARTPIPACRFVLCTPIAILHLLYLVYLHFSIMKTI